MTSCTIFYTSIITILTLHIRIRGCFLSEKRPTIQPYGHVFALRRGNTIHSWIIIDGPNLAENLPGHSCPLCEVEISLLQRETCRTPFVGDNDPPTVRKYVRMCLSSSTVTMTVCVLGWYFVAELSKFQSVTPSFWAIL